MSTKIKPNSKAALRKTPLIVEKRFTDPVELESAKLTQTFLPWIALEAFANNTAKGTDWSQIQYWLYYAEALVALHVSEVAEENTEVAINIGYSIQSLYAIGRRYNASGYKEMKATVEELDSIRLGLAAGDAYKEITEENLLLIVGKHVQRVLSIS